MAEIDDVQSVTFTLNGTEVSVPADGTLLTALRERLPSGFAPIVSVKDGCAPQGQCGCCTVWVDGEPRVSCVTPVARVVGRSVTTLEGVDESVRTIWSEALCATGGSQCGFCTPGIIMRLAVEMPQPGADGPDDNRSPRGLTRETVDKALLAHLCRCTGWQTICEAVDLVAGEVHSHDDHSNTGSSNTGSSNTGPRVRTERDFAAASRRADIEGRSHQTVHPRIALGEGGFADDIAPSDALVAVRNTSTSGEAGEWILGSDAASARRAAGAVQGRKSTVPVSWPLRVDPEYSGSSAFVRTLETTWVEPAYLEPDAVWCVPGGEPVGPLVNGGAFGGKSDDRYVDELRAAARRLADERGRAVRVVMSREDIVRRGPKRPPMALGVRADGSGIMWAARTPGLSEVIADVAPDWQLIEVDVPGPPTSVTLRAAGWAEIAVARCSVTEPVEFPDRENPDRVDPDRDDQDRDMNAVRSLVRRGDHVVAPNGAQAWALVEDVATEDGTRERIAVRVQCGDPLDEVVLRSYCIGAAHMALGWVRSEGIAVDSAGTPVDLTIRSFGVIRAVDTPEIVVEIDHRVGNGRGSHERADSVNGSDAVFAAVAAAVWRHDGFPSAWPSRR